MGYRSDVAISTSYEGYEKFLKKYVELGGNIDSFEYDEKEERHNGVVLWWRDVKWYRRFSMVDKIYEVLNWALVADDEDPDNFPFSFMRLGEEYDDVEIFHNGDVWSYDDLCPRLYFMRSIEVAE